VILSTSSSVFAMLMLGPRVYRKMAVDRVFPAFFQDESYRTTIVLQCVLSAVVCFAGNMLQLMSYLGLTLSACGALAVSSLLWVRKSLPDATPLSVIELVATAVYLTMTFILIAASCTQRPFEFWAMAGTFVVGLVVFVIWHWKGLK
jgi:amino acid transporter